MKRVKTRKDTITALKKAIRERKKPESKKNQPVKYNQNWEVRNMYENMISSYGMLYQKSLEEYKRSGEFAPYKTLYNCSITQTFMDTLTARLEKLSAR